MAFSRATSTVPTSIRKLTLILTKTSPAPDPGMGEEYEASYRVSVADQNGDIISVPGDAGNLVPHLTQAQINSLLTIINDLYNLAVTEIIG